MIEPYILPITDCSSYSKPHKGANIPVVVGATKKYIGWPGEAPAVDQSDTNYVPNVVPSWDTRWWVTNKTPTMFVVHFSKPAPPDATVDWEIVR